MVNFLGMLISDVPLSLVNDYVLWIHEILYICRNRLGISVLLDLRLYKDILQKTITVYGSIHKNLYAVMVLNSDSECLHILMF